MAKDKFDQIFENLKNANYECVLNCKNKDGMNVCEKTSR